MLEADLDKAYGQAYSTPSGYPQLRRISAEEFRRGPITAGRAANAVNYDPPRPWAVPSAMLGAAALNSSLTVPYARHLTLVASTIEDR